MAAAASGPEAPPAPPVQAPPPRPPVSLAAEAEYTRYTSTKEADWRMTLREPVAALVRYLERHDEPDSIHVEEKFRVDSQKRVTSPCFATLHTFEEESILVAGKTLQHRHGGFRISKNLAADGNQVVIPGQFRVGLAVGGAKRGQEECAAVEALGVAERREEDVELLARPREGRSAQSRAQFQVGSTCPVFSYASEGIRFRDGAGGLASIGKARAVSVRTTPSIYAPRLGQGNHVFESDRRPPNPASPGWYP